MSGQSTLDLTGTLEVTTANRTTPLALSQTVAGLEVKTFEFTIPHASASPVSVPLGFSGGVLEALMLHISSPKALIAVITGKDAVSGPIHLGVKGNFGPLTFTPGHGVASLGFINESPTEDVTVEIVVAAKAAATDSDPSFWDA